MPDSTSQLFADLKQAEADSHAALGRLLDAHREATELLAREIARVGKRDDR